MVRDTESDLYICKRPPELSFETAFEPTARRRWVTSQIYAHTHKNATIICDCSYAKKSNLLMLLGRRGAKPRRRALGARAPEAAKRRLRPFG